MVALMDLIGNSQHIPENKVFICSTIQMSTFTSLFLKPGLFKVVLSFFSATRARLLHFRVVSLLPGLFVQMGLDGKTCCLLKSARKKKYYRALWGSHWKIHHSETLLLPNSSMFKKAHTPSNNLDMRITSAPFTGTPSLLKISLETHLGALGQGLAASWC